MTPVHPKQASATKRARTSARAPQRRRQFTPEFKRDAVARIGINGQTAESVARDLGVVGNMLRYWQRHAPPPPPAPAPSAMATALVPVSTARPRTTRYDDAFKQAILVRLATTPGLTPVALAREIGVTATTLRQWIARAQPVEAIPAPTESMVPARLVDEEKSKTREVLDRLDVTDSALVALARLIVQERQGRA